MDGEDQAHDESGCPGLWRLAGAVVDPETGALTWYRCEMCDTLLAVPPGGVHPETA
jgi:hypothetical protein